MSSSSSSEASVNSTFVCDCEEGARAACARERFYKKHDGKRYYVLHFPGKEKSEGAARPRHPP